MRWCVIPEDIILVFLAERKEKSEYMHKYVSIRFFVFGFVFFVSIFFVLFYNSNSSLTLISTKFLPFH